MSKKNGCWLRARHTHVLKTSERPGAHGLGCLLTTPLRAMSFFPTRPFSSHTSTKSLLSCAKANSDMSVTHPGAPCTCGSSSSCRPLCEVRLVLFVCADQSNSGESIVSLCISVCSAGKDSSSVSSFTAVISWPPGSSSVGVTNSVVTSLTVVSVSSSHPSSSPSSLSLAFISSSSSSSSGMKPSAVSKLWLIELWRAQGCRCGESAGGSSVRDSTLRESELLSVRREMVGWDAGVRLGARAGPEEPGIVSAAPPSPSAPEEDGGVWSKKAPSSREEWARRADVNVDTPLITSFTCTMMHTHSESDNYPLPKWSLKH